MAADVEGVFEEARAEHPEFAGQSAVMATLYEGFYFYGQDDPRTRLLTSLGYPQELEQFVGADEFGGNVSEERLDLLDTDVLIWLGGIREVEDTRSFLDAHPLYSTFHVPGRTRQRH